MIKQFLILFYDSLTGLQDLIPDTPAALEIMLNGENSYVKFLVRKK